MGFNTQNQEPAELKKHYYNIIQTVQPTI